MSSMDMIDGRGVFIDAADEVYAEATPVAGTLDPETQVPDPDAGGGRGDPFGRDPERVKHDVRDGYVSIEGARRDFRVVIEGDPHRAPEKLAVNAEATAAERSAASTQTQNRTSDRKV